MQKITPFLWFDTQAEEAAQFYTSIFKDSRILEILYYAEGAPHPEGSVMTVRFEIAGQTFTALNGGPHYAFSPATSFVVNCDTQEEIDFYWDRLVKGGQPQQCGWLSDRYGVTWQIVPEILPELFSNPDMEKCARVTQAMMRMIKLDIDALKKAADA